MEFTLTDKQRTYFGLDPINKKWDRVELKKNVWLFFEGNSIKKVIQIRQRSDYSEADYELKTNRRKTLLPKTSKGKEKPLTLSGIESHMSIHFSFYVRFDRREEFKSGAFSASVTNHHAASSRVVPTPCDAGMKTFAEFSEWINEFIATAPAGYIKEITRLKEEKSIQVSYQSGDLFAFPITRTTYGIGKILLPLKKVHERNLVPASHYFSHVMAVPLLVRLYGARFTCESTISIPPVDPKDLTGRSLLPAYFMQDSPVLRGTYPVIGHSDVREYELDFPLSYDMDSGLLCWGMAMVVTPVPLKTYIDPNTQGILIRNTGVAGGAAIGLLEKFLRGDLLYYEHQLGHPKNEQLRNEIFRAAGTTPTISYDEFCTLTGAISNKDLIGTLNSV